MIERAITAVRTEDPGSESPADTRTRLRGWFAPGATRRMTQLGMLMGSVLRDMPVGPDDSIVYATRYAENQALEAFLASFPAVSPTLFQTSIHPSAVQQVLIGRQQCVRELIPLTGNRQLAAQAVQCALLAPAEQVILCGGDERGNWLREQGLASEETFAFAVSLAPLGGAALGSLRVEFTDAPAGELTLKALFEALRDRRPLHQAAAPGLDVALSWR